MPAPATPRAPASGGPGPGSGHAASAGSRDRPADLPPPAAPIDVVGVDFSSRPTRRKPIVVARGRLDPAPAAPGAAPGGTVTLLGLQPLDTLEAFSAWLADPAQAPWVGGFDLPFGLPRELVEQLGWPTDWPALIRHYAALERPVIRDTFAAFCAARPVGGKFAHRRCDGPAGSSPSMKWVNPPVAYMLHAGVPRLLDAGVDLPGLHPGDPARVALEAYPGLLARELLGARSYKSDEAAKQTPERLIARKDLVDALLQGRSRLGLRLRARPALTDALVADASGDRLDATLCLLQAAWCALRPGWGRPADADPLEGWIATAGPDPAAPVPAPAAVPAREGARAGAPAPASAARRRRA
ncbi:DUF429 domain-containing protein [Piscinibacter sakaiensis]|uniref:DUF429 domain-containing protein n=1 Tax=Piscinibacter sakaiensis TaxID=1547922 RepID=A0A0K8P5K6_PISS1|nr:DUF429 domain-containing protein [Piscinibacter sakaiensis]GAP37490.1 hypothetical protein ISF6_3345 [Piscinibacter sakaiensis]